MEQTMHSEHTLREDPRYLSRLHLEKLGVTRLNRYDVLLQCMTCGAAWAPKLRPDATLPAGYWQCPNRCNW